jgi:hypothetical protein
MKRGGKRQSLRRRTIYDSLYRNNATVKYVTPASQFESDDQTSVNPPTSFASALDQFRAKFQNLDLGL